MPPRKVILEQEDSDNALKESEQWLCERQETPICANNSNIKDVECDNSEISEMKMPKEDINHTEEVIIGTEQGPTFSY